MSTGQKQSKSRQIEEIIFVRVPHIVAGILFFVAAAINFINVIARYVFSDPIFWAEEVLIFLVIWAVFVVAGSITYRGGHLNMDLVYSGIKSESGSGSLMSPSQSFSLPARFLRPRSPGR